MNQQSREDALEEFMQNICNPQKAPVWYKTMKINLAHSVIVYILASSFLLLGCSPTSQVFTDYDRSATIDEYQTFGWLTTSDIEIKNNPLFYNELNDKRIKNAVATQLESRNYKYSNKPELFVHYHIIIDDKTVVRTDPYGYYYGPYWMRSQVNVYQYREGTLIIDLMDAQTNSLVWRGWITSFLKNHDPEQMEERISHSVRMIFSQYPYRASNSDEQIDFQNH